MELVSRRCIISMTGTTLAVLIWELPALIANSRRSFSGASLLDWASFVDKVTTLARRAVDVRTEEAYVDRVQELLGNVDRRNPRLHRVRGPLRKQPGLPVFSSLERTTNTEIQLLSFDPGDSILAHDHPGMTAVMMCVSGAVEVQNYDPILIAASGCLLKQRSNMTLESLQRSTLTSKRGNIHQLESPKGCELIDIFTPPYDKRRVETTRWFRISREPLRKGQLVYSAQVKIL